MVVSSPVSMARATISVGGMSCTSCSSTIENGLRGTAGVLKADVSLSTNAAVVEYDMATLQVNDVVNAIEALGFEATVMETTADSAAAAAGGGSGGATAGSGKSDATGSERRTTRKLMLVIEPLNAADDDGGGFPRKAVPMPDKDRVVAALRATTGVVEASLARAGGGGGGGGGPGYNVAVTIDEGSVGPRALVALVRALSPCAVTVASLGGFLMAAQLLAQQQRERTHRGRQLAVAWALTFPLFVIAMLVPMPDPFLERDVRPGLPVRTVALFALSTPVEFWAGWAFHHKAFVSVRQGQLGMDFLISFGTLAAYASAFWGMVNGWLTGASTMADVMSFQTPAVLISVVLLGKYIECVARGATARSIQVHPPSPLRALLAYTDPFQCLHTATRVTLLVLHTLTLHTHIHHVYQVLSALRAPTARLVRGAEERDGADASAATAPATATATAGAGLGFEDVNLMDKEKEGSGRGSGKHGESGGTGSTDRVIDASLLQVGDTVHRVAPPTHPPLISLSLARASLSHLSLSHRTCQVGDVVPLSPLSHLSLSLLSLSLTALARWATWCAWWKARRCPPTACSWTPPTPPPRAPRWA